MNRCDSCRSLSSCPICGKAVDTLDHVGVRGTTSHLTIPVIDYKVAYDHQPSGIWHYTHPCGHRVHPAPPAPVALKYNGGPLWKDGYIWQNVYWGSYWSKPSSANWMNKTDMATAHLEADPNYSGGLRQYNVGVGKVIPHVVIPQDPSAQISNDQIKKALTDWIAAHMLADIGTNGAYNIFLPPGVTASLSTDLSCKTFCVLPDEIILGDNKSISEYREGDEVVSSTGLQRVDRTFERQLEGDLIIIKAAGMLPVRVTGEHPLLVVSGRHRGWNCNVVAYTAPYWKQANELSEKHSCVEGDYLLMPKLTGSLEVTSILLDSYISPVHNRLKYMKNHNIPTSFPINPQTAWLLGLYVAEGYSTKRGINLVIHEKETELKERLLRIFSELGYRPHIVEQPDGKSIRVGIGAPVLSRFFRMCCGHKATGKQIPDFILYNKDETLLRTFLEGYVAADGCQVVAKTKYKLTIFNTASAVLIRQLQLAFGRLGLFVSVRKSRSGGMGKILGRQVTLHTMYEGKLYPEPASEKMNRLHGGFFCLPIRRITRKHYQGKVYNIETTDNTYLVSNAVVHNCDYHDSVDGPNGPFYTVEPYPCAQGCNQCTNAPFDTLTQGLSEEVVELKTDMDPGTGWVIGNEEICDHCDGNFVCNQISTGEYVNSWYDKSKNACWKGP